MIGLGAGSLWAFLGSLGLREVIVIAVVALIMYGRSGVLLQTTRQGRALRPWIAAARRAAGPANPQSASSKAAPRRSRWGDRLFWFLTIAAATAVGALIVTRTMILGSSGLLH